MILYWRAAWSGLSNLVMSCTVSALLLSPGFSVAEEVPALAGPYQFIKGDRSLNRIQLAFGLKFAQEALVALGTAADAEQLKRAQTLAFTSYVYLRFAMHGVQELIMKSRDESRPTEALEGILAAINRAREYNLEAGRAIENSIPWPETRAGYVDAAIHNIRRSMPFAGQAEILLRVGGVK
jgi:hypothetical protein